MLLLTLNGVVVILLGLVVVVEILPPVRRIHFRNSPRCSSLCSIGSSNFCSFNFWFSTTLIDEDDRHRRRRQRCVRTTFVFCVFFSPRVE
jgi:hypothetical protein